MLEDIMQNIKVKFDIVGAELQRDNNNNLYVNVSYKFNDGAKKHTRVKVDMDKLYSRVKKIEIPEETCIYDNNIEIMNGKTEVK